MSTLKAAPTPSQTGRWNRVCVQANIQGIARSWSMLPAAYMWHILIAHKIHRAHNDISSVNEAIPSAWRA